MVRYTRIIALLYGFYRPLEAGLERLNTLSPARRFVLRARAELLKRDLLALGLEMQAISQLPTCADLLIFCGNPSILPVACMSWRAPV
jgi:hypothetical protein